MQSHSHKVQRVLLHHVGYCDNHVLGLQQSHSKLFYHPDDMYNYVI